MDSYFYSNDFDQFTCFFWGEDIKPSEIIGTTITDQIYNQQLQQQVDLNGRVIGAVALFPYKSVNTVIEPLTIWVRPSNFDQILYIRMTPGDYEKRGEIPGCKMEGTNSWHAYGMLVYRL